MLEFHCFGGKLGKGGNVQKGVPCHIQVGKNGALWGLRPMAIRTPLSPTTTDLCPSIHPKPSYEGVSLGPRPMKKKTPLSHAHNDHEGVPGDGSGSPRTRFPTISLKRGHGAICPSPPLLHKANTELRKGRPGSDVHRPHAGA